MWIQNWLQHLGRASQQGTLGHTGSWGLPDFGVTEAYASGINPGSSDITNAVTSQVKSVLGGGSSQPTTDLYNQALKNSSQINYSPAPTNNAPAPTNNAPDLTNPVKQHDYAVAHGFDTWDQMQQANNRPSADAARQADEARIRAMIQSGFGDYQNRLNQMIPQYQGWANKAKQNLGQGYESIFNQLKQAKQTGLSNLDVSRNQVKSRENQSIEDIQRNMRDVIRATQMKLGAMGAGGSSASEVMAPYAYTKLGGQQAGLVQRQANDQFFEIDKQVNDTKNTFEQLMSKTEQDKVGKMQEIEDKYNSLIANIQDRLAQAPVQEQQALANLAQSFAGQKIAELSQIDAEDRAMKQRIAEWGSKRLAQLHDYQLQLQQKSNFSPQELVYQELKPMGALGSTKSSSQFYNPMALKKRKDNTY